MTIDQDSPDFVTSVARGLSVIRSFGQGNSTLTLAEVAERTDLTRPTARRFLLTLEALGYVRTDGKRFWLAPKTLDLGYAFLSSMSISDIAHASMQHVVELLNESCSMAVLDRSEIVYVARVPPKHRMGLQVGLGSRMPLYCNSSGRVLMADMSPQQLDDYFANTERLALTRHTVTDETALRAILAEVKTLGYALIDQEVEEGLRAIAVPIRSREGRVVAGVSVGAHTGRVSREEMIDKILPPLKVCAREIEHLLIRSDVKLGR
jgi:IclR family pca regulon transcriptional regulator